MLKKIAALTLAVSSVVLADATTQPTTKKHFPTAAELAHKLVAQQKKDADKLQVAYFDLNQQFAEKPADFSLFGEPQPTLRELLAHIEQAQNDPTIKAALFYVGSGSGLNLSQAGELRDALIAMNKAGKKTVVYADTYDTAAYTVASGASRVTILTGGEIFVPGIGFETMFYKNAFDKLGVQADYVQIGEYKGAEEPFTRTGPSDELKGELNKLVDAYYKQITTGIADHRHLKLEDVKSTIDLGVLPAKQAKEAGWVDDLVDPDGLRDLMKTELGGEVNLQHDYGLDEKPKVDLNNVFSILAFLNRRPPVSNKDKVAVIYAEGMIVDGESRGSLFGGSSIGSENIRAAMRLADRDDTVKAVVIRIDSPGGSALASEAMWQSVRRVEKKKPIIISIGSMAASGGYYLASSGDWIVADPTAIVGSIGVVGGKFVMNGLYDKLGLTTEMFSRGANANLFSSTSAFDDRQKKLVTGWMKDTYTQFTDRVMTTRTGKIQDIDKVARGRIFLAADAKDLGMVDEIGGIRTAIADAADRAKLKAGDYDVTVLPPATTFADVLAGKNGADAAATVLPKMQTGLPGLLGALPADIRASLGNQLGLMSVLQDRPVALMSPWVLRVK